MKKNIKLFQFIIFISILPLTNSKAEFINKIIMSIGNEMVTNYDMEREIKYLNVITVGQFKTLNEKESKKIALDSLIKDNIKVNEMANHDYIMINDEMIDVQIFRTIQDLGFGSIEGFKEYLEFEKYKFDEFKEKIILELKWNQLIYQFYKNQIVIDKKKIDKKLKTLIAEKEIKEEYLIHEIFIEDSVIKKSNKNSEEELLEDKVVEKKDKTVEEYDGIVIKTESASYDNTKNIIDIEKSVEEMPDIKIKNKITIDKLMENIKKKGFENTAIEFSSSSTSQQGGNLGWINESEFSEILFKFIKNLEIGKITKPIPIPGGVIILKVENKRIIENKIDFDKKMKELVEIEKNKQLIQFSSNYFNQVKNNIKINYYND